jgi:hypothetical protein
VSIFMAFGSGFERFEVQKTLQRGSYTPYKKTFFGGGLTGVACWKLKGLHSHLKVGPSSAFNMVLIVSRGTFLATRDLARKSL